MGSPAGEPIPLGTWPDIPSMEASTSAPPPPPAALPGTSGEKIELIPEKPFADEIDPETLDGLKPTEDIAVHEKNWFDCIRSGKQPNAGIDLATKVQTVISLAEMSERLGITCTFDEKSRKVTQGGGKEVKPITYGTLELS